MSAEEWDDWHAKVCRIGSAICSAHQPGNWAHLVHDALAIRTQSDPAAHLPGCQEFPTGWLCVSECTTVWHDKPAQVETREQIKAEALREAAEEWGGSANWPTCGADAFVVWLCERADRIGGER